MIRRSSTLRIAAGRTGPSALRAATAVALLAAFATHAPAQDARTLYEVVLGVPDTAEVPRLLRTPAAYVGRAVQTHGRLTGDLQKGYRLVADRGSVALIPEPLVAPRVAVVAQMSADTEVTVSGLFLRLPKVRPDGVVYAVRAWDVAIPEAAAGAGSEVADAEQTTLEDLVYGSGRFDGETIRVSGAFRGRNLKHDLPERTARSTRDWILKDGHYAVWVEGREPSGPGWKLDPQALGDTGVWLDVVGTPETREGIVRIKARAVTLASEPGDDLAARPSLGSGPGWADVSPLVSFAFPMPGDPLDAQGRFVLQFNKHMDVASLRDRVRVSWSDESGSEVAPDVGTVYVDRYRAVVVVPEAAPPPGATVACALLEGIIDVDGRALTPRKGAPPGEGVVDVVRLGPGASTR